MPTAKGPSRSAALLAGRALILGLLILCLSAPAVRAQGIVGEVADRFTFDLAGEEAVRAGAYPSKLVTAPIVGYRPISGLGFGGGAQFLFKPFGAGAETRTSQVGLSGLYTLKSQILVTSTYYVFSPGETWLLDGEFVFSDFPTVYYGIGNTSSLADEGEITITGLEADPILYRKIFSRLYAGVGIHYHWAWDVTVDREGGRTARRVAGTEDLTFGDFTAAGLQLAVTWDSRNNTNYPSRGYYARVRHGIYENVAGGTQSFRTLQAQGSHYFQPWSFQRSVVAMEVYGRFTWGDEIPVPELSSLGGAYRLRGYEAGRYVDRHTVMAQAEYRLHIWDRIGAAVFVGAGDVFADTGGLDASTLKYSAGGGLRVALDERERLNVRLDYGRGFGHESDGGFYVAISETF